MSQNSAGEKAPQVECDSDLKRAAMENDTTSLKQKLAPYLYLHYEFLATLLFLAFHHRSYDFVVEILRLKPELAWAKNTNGQTVMHISCEHGLFRIVNELANLDHNICLVRDNQGRSPIHIAAANGRLKVLQELALTCPDSLLELTSSKETALLVAAKYGQVESFQFLMKQCLEHKNSWQLKKRDDEGNTVFSIAASTNQEQIVQMLRLHKNASRRYIPRVLRTAQQALNSTDSMMVEQAILVLMAGGAFAALSNYNNMFQQQRQARTATFSIKDIISAPNLLPLGFYYIAFITEVFIMSMVMISKSISSPGSWTVRHVEVLLFLVVFFFFAFLLMVKLLVPHFFVKIIFSLKISSFWFVLLLDLAFVLVLPLVVFMVKKIRGIFHRRKKPFREEEEKERENYDFPIEIIPDEGQSDNDKTSGDTFLV